MTLVLIGVATLGGGLAGALLAMRGARQCRRPSHRAGRAVLHRMNVSHAELTTWALSHVQIGRAFAMLDVGCGGGRTIERLASAAPDGKVYGIDYSEESVAVARETNRAQVARGRVDIQQGAVSRLPFADDMLDLVVAIETHYYWPDLPHDVQEVMRVLRPGGTFLLVAETYRGRKNDWLYRPVMRLILRAAYLSVEEHRHLLANAGYVNVEVFEDRSRGWICAVARKA
jgi:ubiquinone/menaquinone biosynthesis C-methylase UbiE